MTENKCRKESVFDSIAMGEFARGILSEDIVLFAVRVQNYFPARYNSRIAAQTASVLEMLLTLVERVQPHGIFLKKKVTYLSLKSVRELFMPLSIEQTEIVSF